tara:strand:- start:106 stop:579 length:474 start_codon:yes stop_codon:yes gene_type:complete
MSNLYFLIQAGLFYATHDNDRAIFIATQNVETSFELRKSVIKNIDVNQQLLTKYKSARKHTRGESLHLTGTADASQESIKCIGICKIPFELIQKSSLIRRMFDCVGADVFVVEDAEYRSDLNLLSMNGIRLDRESYQSPTSNGLVNGTYLQNLLDTS